MSELETSVAPFSTREAEFKDYLIKQEDKSKKVAFLVKFIDLALDDIGNLMDDIWQGFCWGVGGFFLTGPFSPLFIVFLYIHLYSKDRVPPDQAWWKSIKSTWKWTVGLPFVLSKRWFDNLQRRASEAVESGWQSTITARALKDINENGKS